MTIINNDVCDSIKPVKADAVALRCLAVLLNGGRLNRKTLAEMDIADNNASLHSLVSILRNEKFIPIMSDRISDGTCDYYMKQEEIARYRNQTLRKQQYEEMKTYVESRRQRKMVDDFSLFLDWLENFPQSWWCSDYLLLTLEDLAKKINALLENKKGVN